MLNVVIKCNHFSTCDAWSIIISCIVKIPNFIYSLVGEMRHLVAGACRLPASRDASHHEPIATLLQQPIRTKMTVCSTGC